MSGNIRWFVLWVLMCIQCLVMGQTIETEQRKPMGEVVTLGESSKDILLRNKIQMIAETRAAGQAVWGPQDASAALAQGGAIPVRLTGLPYRSDLPHWGMVKLSHDAAQADWVVYYRLATLENIQAYAREEGGAWQDLAALHGKRSLMSGYHYPSFALPMPRGKSIELALRVQTRAPIRMPVLVTPAYRFYENQRSDLVQTGIALAVPLVVLLYLAILLPRTVHVGLGWFMALIALESVGAMWVSGHGHVVFPVISRDAWPIIGRLAYMGMVVVGWLHVLRFVGAQRLHALLRGAGWVVVAVIVISGLLEIFQLANTRDVFTLSIIFFPCIALATCWYGHAQGVRYAGIYAWAWSAFVLSALISVLGLVGIAAVTSWNVYYAQSSVAAVLFGLVAVGHVREREQLISAERLRNQQLEDTLAIQKRFFAATNHDLHQPLHSLGIYVDLARNRLAQIGSADSRLAEFLSDAKAAHQSASQFLDSLLDVARMESKLDQVHLQSVDLAPLLERLGREYQLLAGRAGLELRIVPTQATVFSDPHRLERIIRNLLANAVRYTKQGGVLLAVRPCKGQWRLDVVDTGLGLSPEQCAQLFKPFQTLQQATTTQPSFGSAGLGLGLFIVQGLSQSLNHQVEVVSRLGRGSRFSVRMRMPD